MASLRNSLTGLAAEQGSEEFLYRALIEGVTDYAIYMLDPTGIVSSWNPGARRFKGYEAAEIIGSHFERFYTPEDRAAALPRRALEIAEREGRFEKEGWRLRKDGSRFWAHVVIDPIRRDGRLIGFAKITRDLTERREAGRQLEQAREALFQSQKLETIGQLTGGVAHDFNNLLMAILSSLEIIRRRLPEDPRITPFIASAIQQANRGAALTKRMLAFARHQNLDLKPLDVGSLMRGLAELLQRSLGPTAWIEMRVPPFLPLVLADANQLELALLNLTMNARDALPEGGVITIEAAEQIVPPGPPNLPPGVYVRLSVTDTGIGMDAETLARAAEPFFTTKDVGKGTGLGLSVVHGMAEQSGGKLVLKSEKGRGTTVEIWLPRHQGKAAEQSSRSDAPAPKHERKRAILVVDDESVILMNTAAMLEELGHDTLQASSAEQALALLRAGRTVDLVLTDHAMPRMTGLQLAKEIRATWPAIPIILASGYAELPGETGNYAVRLDKPFGPDDLARAVSSILNIA